MEEDVARGVNAGIPGFAGYDGPLERMGGLTNAVFRAGDAVLRLPGKGTEDYIDRANEAVAAREAARAGVSPEVLFVDPDTGVMVTRYIPDTVTMTPEAFRTRPGAPGPRRPGVPPAPRLRRRLPARFELFAMIDDYLKRPVHEGRGAAPTATTTSWPRRGRARGARCRPLPLGACHCDPLCENFLDTGTRMWIVDWEYSGMNDPMWD
jgi:thiamine kinase-like enzyme